MSKIKVGVLRGGMSDEYEVSLRTGEEVLLGFPEDKYETSDILITKDGVWHMNGFPTTPEKTSRFIDVYFNALHGKYGEDGEVQRTLDHFGVPYTGSESFASSISLNKKLAKSTFELSGIKTPRAFYMRAGDDISQKSFEIFSTIAGPYVLKPVSSGSSVGVELVHGLHNLISSVNELLKTNEMVMVEENIKGREVSCGVIDGLDSVEPYPMHLVEIISPEPNDIWKYADKYNGKTLEVCPANIEAKRTKQVQDIAVEAHKATGMRHYSKSDFIISPNGIYLLEINSLPGLTKESPFRKSLHRAGFKIHEFLDYVATLALHKK